MAEVGEVYLLHFERRLSHARHYIGWCRPGMTPWRLKRHRKGNGARILHALNEKGIGYEVVRQWNGVTRDFERMLKNKKRTPELCPLCRYEKLIRRKEKKGMKFIVTVTDERSQSVQSACIALKAAGYDPKWSKGVELEVEAGDEHRENIHSVLAWSCIDHVIRQEQG